MVAGPDDGYSDTFITGVPEILVASVSEPAASMIDVSVPVPIGIGAERSAKRQ
jgi:hypothetical protein